MYFFTASIWLQPPTLISYEWTTSRGQLHHHVIVPWLGCLNFRLPFSSWETFTFGLWHHVFDPYYF